MSYTISSLLDIVFIYSLSTFVVVFSAICLSVLNKWKVVHTLTRTLYNNVSFVGCFCFIHFHSVYDLQFLDEIYKEIAHDSEILSISYSPTTSGKTTVTAIVLLPSPTCLTQIHKSYMYSWESYHSNHLNHTDSVNVTKVQSRPKCILCMIIIFQWTIHSS